MKITNENEVVERIISLINELHPAKTPRIDLHTPSFKRPSTDIKINLVENDNMPYTFINILDGTESFKQSVPKGEILTDVFLDTKILKKLIDYILTNFPIVYSFNVNEYSISINFSFSKNNSFYETSGLSLENVNLEISIRDLKLKNKLKEYLIFIISTYESVLKQTSFWQENIQKYKKKILFEMEYNYIIDFISYLTEDEIRKLLANISNERFIEVMNELTSKAAKLERLK